MQDPMILHSVHTHPLDTLEHSLEPSFENPFNKKRKQNSHGTFPSWLAQEPTKIPRLCEVLPPIVPEETPVPKNIFVFDSNPRSVNHLHQTTRSNPKELLRIVYRCPYRLKEYALLTDPAPLAQTCMFFKNLVDKERWHAKVSSDGCMELVWNWDNTMNSSGIPFTIKQLTAAIRYSMINGSLEDRVNFIVELNQEELHTLEEAFDFFGLEDVRKDDKIMELIREHAENPMSWTKRVFREDVFLHARALKHTSMNAGCEECARLSQVVTRRASHQLKGLAYIGDTASRKITSAKSPESCQLYKNAMSCVLVAMFGNPLVFVWNKLGFLENEGEEQNLCVACKMPHFHDPEDSHTQPRWIQRLSEKTEKRIHVMVRNVRKFVQIPTFTFVDKNVFCHQGENCAYIRYVPEHYQRQQQENQNSYVPAAEPFVTTHKCKEVTYTRYRLTMEFDNNSTGTIRVAVVENQKTACTKDLRVEFSGNHNLVEAYHVYILTQEVRVARLSIVNQNQKPITTNGRAYQDINFAYPGIVANEEETLVTVFLQIQFNNSAKLVNMHSCEYPMVRGVSLCLHDLEP